jgi:hypothetical protein
MAVPGQDGHNEEQKKRKKEEKADDKHRKGGPGNRRAELGTSASDPDVVSMSSSEDTYTFKGSSISELFSIVVMGRFFKKSLRERFLGLKLFSRAVHKFVLKGGRFLDFFLDVKLLMETCLTLHLEVL